MSSAVTETVSVLMSDLVGSTAMADRLGSAAAGHPRALAINTRVRVDASAPVWHGTQRFLALGAASPVDFIHKEEGRLDHG